MGFNLFHEISKGTKKVGHSFSKSTKSSRKWLKGAGDTIGGGLKDTGKWFKGAGDSILGDLENLTSPTTLIIIAVALVAGVIFVKQMSKSN